jgi:hypothetical protein
MALCHPESSDQYHGVQFRREGPPWSAASPHGIGGQENRPEPIEEQAPGLEGAVAEAPPVSEQPVSHDKQREELESEVESRGRNNVEEAIDDGKQAAEARDQIDESARGLSAQRGGGAHLREWAA